MSLPVLATEETQPTCCSSTNVYRFLHDIGILRQRATTVHHHHPCHEQAAMKSSQTTSSGQRVQKHRLNVKETSARQTESQRKRGLRRLLQARTI